MQEVKKALLGGAVVGLIVGLLTVAFVDTGLEYWREAHHEELTRRAVAQVELRVAARKRELDICQDRLLGYQEIAALADSLERARAGRP